MMDWGIRRSIMFHVRRRPADYVPRKRKKKPSGKWNEVEHRYEDERLPFLLELNPDGSELANGGVRHRLQPNVTEVGSDRPIGPQAVQAQTLTLTGPTIMPRHCVIAFTDNIVTLTPCSRDAHTYVNNQRIHQTTILQNGAVIKFGRMHTFRFIDPAPEDRIRQRHDSSRQMDYSYDRLSQYERQQPRGTDPILPAVLEFLEETEETFFHAVITDVEPSAPQFKLAPTYTLYLAARYRASTHYRPELQPTERAHRLTVMLANVATMIQRVIQERYMDASSLALWLANGSELLHMLKSDRHVGAFSTRAQDILAQAVNTAFNSLVRCVSLELAPAMSQFMADAADNAKEAGVLQIFSNTMALLRRCRVNAALTIQLFSHLFHSINATAFNTLVSNGNLCVRWFGRRLKTRLDALETWAERQGLELASQCHLATIMQATHLLQAPKFSAEELSSWCFKLNSLQVRALLEKYQTADDEPRLSSDFVEKAVAVAETVADALARTDGREIRLEEEATLALDLLLPEDGYSCEVIRGVPPGLAEFLAPLQRDGLCRMAAQPTSSGYWTIYMIDHNTLRSPSAMSNRSAGYASQISQNQNQPEIQIIQLQKSPNGMGLSIVAAKGAGQDRLGIYIKSVVAGGAADADGRLAAGDQLLKVDGQSLVGISQEKAAEYLVRTGPIVTLEVAKQGAIYHGLATLLSQPSPVMNRANKARPKSEHFENPSRLKEVGSNQASSSHSVGNLLSVPQHTVYHEQTVDWDPENTQSSGASIPRVNSIPPQASYCTYIPKPCQSLNHPIYQHQQIMGMRSNLMPAICPKMLMQQHHYGYNNSDYVEVYKQIPIEREYAHPQHYWTNSQPVMHEPNEVFLALPNQNQHYPPYSEKSRAHQYTHYGHDDTEYVLPTIRSRSQENFSISDYCQESYAIPYLEETCVDDDPRDLIDEQLINKEPPEGYRDECDEACTTDDHSASDESRSTHLYSRDEGDSPSQATEATVISVHRNTAMPELNLDLSGINSDISSDESNAEKCWKSPDEVRLGCGRVAALAKHFSQLGEAGLIKFHTKKLVNSRQFASEPDIASPSLTETKKRNNKNFEKYKSESELLKSNKNGFISPVNDWSTILLDIQAKEMINENDTDSFSKLEKKDINRIKKCSYSKSTLKHHKKIGQLKEFANFEVSRSPTCLPSSSASSCGSNSDKETMTDSNEESLESLQAHAIKIPQGQTMLSGSLRLEHFRNHSLPTIFNTLNVFPELKYSVGKGKVNSLSKYWSLKDLASVDDLTSNNSSNYDILSDSARYIIFPTCNRVVSAPHISDEPIKGYDLRADDVIHSSTNGYANHTTISVGCQKNADNGSENDDGLKTMRSKSTNDICSGKCDRTTQCDTDKLRSKSCEKLSNCNMSYLKSNKAKYIGTGYDKVTTIIIRRKAKSDLDISDRTPTPRFDKTSWVLKDIPAAEDIVADSRPRRMSERDLPSRLGHDGAPQQIHSSKSVPALHNVGNEGKAQHEVFNPGYSRTSSSNSVTPPVQPPPMPAMNGASSLRSRSSHNLHDSSRSGNLPPTGLMNRQQSSPNLNPSHLHGQNVLQGSEAERFYQNLSVYRHQELPVKQQPSPPQVNDDRGALNMQKNLVRGSQSSLNRPINEINHGKDRPMSAYITHQSQQAYPSHMLQHQQQQGHPPRSHSSRDIIRQEAKLQEMQEEVRRRELRGVPPPAGGYRSNTYNPRPTAMLNTNSVRPTRPLGSTPNLGPTSPNYRHTNPNYIYPEMQYNQYSGNYNKQIMNQLGGMGKQYVDHNRQYTQNGPQYSNGSDMDVSNFNYPNAGQVDVDGNDNPPARPALPQERHSPPPPLPNSATHPLYNKQTDSSRYTASMQDPPRGGYYPANTGNSQQARPYQFSVNPWQREEKEKEQAMRREAARQWRDQQIAELSAIVHRTSQQEEQLRALQLERDFQKRAEEAAAQQDEDDESNDLENESVQRVQGLLRTATTQDRTYQQQIQNQQINLSRNNFINQASRTPLSPQSVGSQIQMTNVPVHTVSSQQGGISNSYGVQNESNSYSSVNQNSTVANPYSGSNLSQSNSSQKSNSMDNIQLNEKRMDELKKRQTEFDENLQQQYQYQQQQTNLRNQQQLHPGMLRLDNLVIDAPSSPVSQTSVSEAPPPPERISSYAIMSHQSALRSNNSANSMPTTVGKRVSFHDANANTDPPIRGTNNSTSNLISHSITMDTIREDPNNFINDAEMLLASPKTPEGTGGLFGGGTPGVIGAQEVYRDPRQKRLAEKQRQQQNLQMGAVPEKLSFKEKMKMFAMETGEDGTPRDKVKISRAQREIDNIGSPLSSNNNN